MHRAETITAALDLAARGVSASTIAGTLDLPRSTVRDWIRHGPPGRLAGIETSCQECGGPAHDFADLPDAYLYLLGLYLGDGCVSAHPRGVYKLRVFLDARYPGILDECQSAIEALTPRNKVGRLVRAAGGFANSREGRSIEIYAHSRAWPCLIPQHGPGRKHERVIALTEWQERLVERNPGRLLRGLIHSDGCRFINTGTNWSHPRYSFSNRSDDIRGIFIAACDSLGVRHTEAPHTVYVSRSTDVALLDEHIGPKR